LLDLWHIVCCWVHKATMWDWSYWHHHWVNRLEGLRRWLRECVKCKSLAVVLRAWTILGTLIEPRTLELWVKPKLGLILGLVLWLVLRAELGARAEATLEPALSETAKLVGPADKVTGTALAVFCEARLTQEFILIDPKQFGACMEGTQFTHTLTRLLRIP